MGYSFIFHPTARKELEEAFLWYDQRLEGLGDRFAKAVEKSLKSDLIRSVVLCKKERQFSGSENRRIPLPNRL